MRPTHRPRTCLLHSAALLAACLALSSCLLDPSPGMKVSGRLEGAFGCYTLDSQGRIYELTSWHDPIPPLGSIVVLRVKPRSGASTCMVGPMVEVLRVIETHTNFRTAPVRNDETWGADGGPIVLGKVEVLAGATLTILPGTVVTIIDYGELRVRGALVMAGTPDDSIRIVGSRSGLHGGGRVVIDSTASARLEYASLASLSVHGRDHELQNLRAEHVTIASGSARLRHIVTSGLSVHGGHATVEDAELGNVDGISAEFAIQRSGMTQLVLSYSNAAVQDSRFEGDRTYVLFHGLSGGTFEHNAFRAAETAVEVRHNSTPVFRDNDFIGPAMRVECGSYQLPTCVSMENNWWGTAEEEQIRAKIQAGCPVCIEPWRTDPVGMTALP